MEFFYMPGCKDCETARKWLDKHGVEYTPRDMIADPISAEELLDWSTKFKMPLKGFMRPNRFSLRALLLNNQMLLMERETVAYAIAGVPQYISRPILACDEFVVCGMDNSQWRKALKIFD